MSEPGDYNCRAGAEAIAAAVRAYWAAQGHTEVHTWVESARHGNGIAAHNIVWCVRSNLVNGRPPQAPESIPRPTEHWHDMWSRPFRHPPDDKPPGGVT